MNCFVQIPSPYFFFNLWYMQSSVERGGLGCHWTDWWRDRYHHWSDMDRVLYHALQTPQRASL